VKIFVSHNWADKETARLLAKELVARGIDVWFDEWQIKPGDSITGGVESGISQCELFVLLWSDRAARSNWVETELRAALKRRIDDQNFRVIPVMLDETPLPTLVADYRGFSLLKSSDLEFIASEISGDDSALDTVQRLQRRLLELVVNEFPEDDSIRALLCPRCGSQNLYAEVCQDPIFNETIYYVKCNHCELTHGTKASISPPNPGLATDGWRRR
jgi:hypothetical protein